MKQYILLTFIPLLLTACNVSISDEQEKNSDITLRVVTSFYPQTYFAEQVAGDFAEVQQIVTSGADPHTYEPTPRQIQQVYDADIFIFNGAGQDEWAERIHEELKENGVRILIATEIANRISYEAEEYEEEHDEKHVDEHQEAHEEEHDHGEWDPHVWLDPMNAQKIVEKIALELADIDPAHATEYMEHANSFIEQLHMLDTDMRTGLSNCMLDSVIVSHDAFRYLANRYGFSTLEIAGLSPSAEPSPARLAELANVAQEKGIYHVFFETQVSPALSTTLADEIGAETLVLHSIETLTKEEQAEGMTYIDLMRKNLNNLRIALQCS